MKESFTVFHSYIDAFDTLTDAELGALMRGMMSYSMTGEEPDLSGAAKTAFIFIRREMDADAERIERGIDQRRAAAASRWSKKTEAENAKPMRDDADGMRDDADGMRDDAEPMRNYADGMRNYADGMRNYAAAYKKDEKSEKERSKEKEKKEEKISVPDGTERAPVRVPAREELDASVKEWNETLTDLPHVRSMTESRRARLRSAIIALKKQGVAWSEYLRRIAASDFLCGRSGGWRADFDFCTRPSTIPKVIEGSYDNRTRGNPNGRSESYAESLYADF